MKMANNAMEAGKIFEEERQKEQIANSVNGAIIQTAREMQNMNNRLVTMDEAQKAEHELNKTRDKTNAKIASITKWLSIATLIISAATLVATIIK